MTDNELLQAMSNMMDDKLKPVSDRIDRMDGRLKKIEVTQENIVLPRLQNIEECYISTYERYQKGVEKIEKMGVDIDVIKKIVEDHSERFRKFRVVKT